MRAAFEDAGYGEVHTPALEYEEVLLRGDARAAGARYRSFDEQGAVLALRSDMTIPIARVVATRYAYAKPPLRFSYLAHAWRATDRGVGEPREFLQAGLELIGIPGADGEAEVVAIAVEALAAAGLRRHRIGVGRRRPLPQPAGFLRRAARAAPAAARDALAARPGGPGGPGATSSSWAARSATCSCACRCCGAAARSWSTPRTRLDSRAPDATQS